MEELLKEAKEYIETLERKLTNVSLRLFAQQRVEFLEKEKAHKIKNKKTEVEESDYWRGYKKVYIINYCIGEIGSLVWHSRGVYEFKENAINEKDELLKKIEKLKGEYFFIFGKEFNYSDLNRARQEEGYIFCNQDIRIANVVVTPYRIEDFLSKNYYKK